MWIALLIWGAAGDIPMESAQQRIDAYRAAFLKNPDAIVAEPVLLDSFVFFWDTPPGQLCSIFVMILIGVCAQHYRLVPLHVVGLIRKFTFNVILPSFFLHHMWTVKLDTSIRQIAYWSFIVHALWVGVTYVTYRSVQDTSLRGWLMLMSMGGMMSTLYPLLDGDKRYGERAVGAALLWDVGGNVWICQMVLWVVAAYFAPQVDSYDLEDKVIHSAECHDVDDAEIQPMTEVDEFRPQRRTLQGSPVDKLLALLKASFSQPILPAFLFGFLMNGVGMPMVAPLETLLVSVSNFFKPCLFFIVGAYMQFTRDPEVLKVMATAVAGRTAILIALSVIVHCLPLEEMLHQVLTLALWSPSSTLALHFLAEVDYEEKYLRYSVSVGTAYVFVSVFVQRFLTVWVF